MIFGRPAGRVLSLAVAASLLVLSACGGDDDSDGGGSSVTIYSGRTQNLVGPILEEFAAETGISVQVRYGQSADLALLIEEEAAAGQARADVFLSQSPGAMGFLASGDRLAQLPDDLLDQVPAYARDPDGRWVGVSGRQRVLVYNTDLVTEDELPASVYDLVDDEWEGRVGIAPSNGSFQDFVTLMRASEGDEATAEWLRGMADNDAVTFPNNNSIVAAVGRGEVDVGLVNHYYNFRFLDENPTHPGANHLFPAEDPGSVLIITGAAAIEGTDRFDEATALIGYLLGPAGQQYFAEETFEYPLAVGQQPAGDVPVVEFDAATPLDGDLLGEELATTREMIADAGLDG